jgi:hypothetical protein
MRDTCPPADLRESKARIVLFVPLRHAEPSPSGFLDRGLATDRRLFLMRRRIRSGSGCARARVRGDPAPCWMGCWLDLHDGAVIQVAGSARLFIRGTGEALRRVRPGPLRPGDARSGWGGSTAPRPPMAARSSRGRRGCRGRRRLRRAGASGTGSSGQRPGRLPRGHGLCAGRFPVAAVPHAERHIADIDPVQLEADKHEPHLPHAIQREPRSAGRRRRLGQREARSSTRSVRCRPSCDRQASSRTLLGLGGGGGELAGG